MVVAYLQREPGACRVTLRKAAAALAPGGMLLAVGHHSTNPSPGTGGPPNPAVLLSPKDVVADLAGCERLTMGRAERARRPVAGAERDAIGTLVRLRRQD
ncbi:MAG TPA: hypothetical protein VFA63_16505 [Pseudonocardiaceae bacterium]|nr:hypothetical protein [Pseudonocardiaceae bacterium]